MASASPRLLARLYRDLAELQEQPYPGVAVFIDDADIRKFCLVLTPPAGPWKGLALHFDVVLPPSWPSLPPSVSSSVHGIDHPNLFGGYICCDLLKPMDWLEDGYTGGYTPALTLRGLFLQFLTFFSSTFVEQDYGGRIEIGDALVSSFALEKDLATLQLPRLKCCRFRYPECGCGSLQGHQRDLEGRWRVDTRPETIIGLYEAVDGKVTHKAKGAAPHPDRIHAFEKRNPRWQSTLDLIQTWKCRRCPYGSTQLPHQPTGDALSVAVSQVFASAPDHSRCFLHLLDDDVLLEVASKMPSEDVITFGHAYPRFQTLASAHRILLLRELHCFFLKKPLNQGILGVGVSYEPASRTLSSDFDWLSLEAFAEHDVRKSVQKRGFEFFLPLAFNEGHFTQAREEIWRRVGLIDTAIRQAEVNRQATNNGRGRGSYGAVPARVSSSAPAPPHARFNVVFKMMNNIVVSLMKSCDDALTTSRRSSSSPNLLQASEKAVISYCHLMHLLIRISGSHPPFLQAALGRVRSFLQAPANRTKDATPDMGELIVAITLVQIMFPAGHANVPTWSSLSGSFLEEAITRNVRWVLKDAPELEIMEEGASDYRLTTTFSKSRTSLRLIMFQITFLDMFIGVYHKIGIQSLDQNYGFPESHLPVRMVEEIKAIYKVDDWPAFFVKVQFGKVFSKRIFTGMLRDAVTKSRDRRYHIPARPAEMNRLRIVRRELERARAEAEARKSRNPR